jgi:hypothetical protein
MLAQQGQELPELDAALPDAGARSDGCVEGLGIAGVQHLDPSLLAAGDLGLELRSQGANGVVAPPEQQRDTRYGGS